MHSTPQLPSRSNTTARFLTSACAFVRVERLHRVGQAAHSVHDRDCGWGQEGLTGGYSSTTRTSNSYSCPQRSQHSGEPEVICSCTLGR